MSKNYFKNIEQKWQKIWSEQELFTVKDDEKKPKFYCLEMFPYPSGILHMGHMRNYCIGDTVAWYKRLCGFNVLHPIGWDSFGQPAEQAAIKNQVQPSDWTEKNIEHMKGQLKRLGISYDWNTEIATHRAEYYTWNQWFFLRLYEKGLVYRQVSPVNWCSKEQTVLSNEQAADGKCWRCKTKVIENQLTQWFIKITAYADELLEDMEQLKANWPAKVLKMQQNWIGRSESIDESGKKTVSYNLHDWGISRQRFWGTPIPMIHCEFCGIVPVEEKNLPVLLPIQAEFTGIGDSPLGKIPEFVNSYCPKCGKKAKRETDTMDTFVDSAWYYFRYCDPKNNQMPFDKDKIAKYLPIDLYIGGVDNAVMHLLYTRFWSKVARDMGLVSFNEPIKSLLTQGMVLGEVKSCLKSSWQAMSKSLRNGVDPDEMIHKYSVDPVRLFVLFAAPPEQELRWSEKGIEGTVRFLYKVHDLIEAWIDIFVNAPKTIPVDSTVASRIIRQLTHKTIARVTYDIERFHFNTCVSALMEFVNSLSETDIMLVINDFSVQFAIREALGALVLMLTPFAPHFAEEMWQELGNQENILSSKIKWPKYETELTQDHVISMAVQINGKFVTRINTSVSSTREEIQVIVLADEKVKAKIIDRTIVKIIVVPNRLINLVVN